MFLDAILVGLIEIDFPITEMWQTRIFLNVSVLAYSLNISRLNPTLDISHLRHW